MMIAEHSTGIVCYKDVAESGSKNQVFFSGTSHRKMSL